MIRTRPARLDLPFDLQGHNMTPIRLVELLKVSLSFLAQEGWCYIGNPFAIRFAAFKPGGREQSRRACSNQNQISQSQ